MSADGDAMESIPAIPPDWSDLTNSQVSQFAESLGSLLNAGILPGGLAEELSAYREKANNEIRARLRDAEKRRAAAGNGMPFRSGSPRPSGMVS